MRIAWCSIDALTEAIEVYDPDTVVSISSPRYPTREIDERTHIRMLFHDVEARSLRTFDKIVPDHRHVGALLDLITGRRPERLLIHCTAGLSRSPAMAIIVAAVHCDRTPLEICTDVLRQVPHAQPNRMILACADELLGTDILSAATASFAYTRGYDHPKGERAGLCELSMTSKHVEVVQ